MGTFSGFVQVILGPSADHVLLMSQIVLQHFLQVQDPGLQASLVGNKRKHIYAEGILKLGVLEQLIQHYVRIGVFSQIDRDTHTLTAGMIVKVYDAVDFLLPHQFSDLGDQTGFVHQERKLRDNDLCPPVRRCLDAGDCTDPDLSFSCPVGFFDPAAAHDGGSRGEIRSFYDIQQFFNRCFPLFFHRVVDDLYHSIDHFPQVMRRNIRRHSYGNTGSTVDQKIRITGRQDYGFTLCLVKVRLEIHGIFVDIRKHFHGDLAQPCLCITHGSCSVTIHGTEIAVTVHQRIPERPVLCHVHQSTVNGAVSMGMIFTHRITDDTGTLSVRLVRSVVQFDHGIQNTSLNRFQSIPHIRKGPRSDDAHGIVDIRLLHGFFEVYVMDFIKNIVFHMELSLLNV